MLFEGECLPGLLKCPICKLKMEEAKILPCGVYCKSCIQKMIETNEMNEIKCKSCHKRHTIPEDGFMSWKALDEYYSEEPMLEKIYRGESAEKLKVNLKKVLKQIDDLNFHSENGIDVVKEHCSKLRNQVMLESEVSIRHIQEMTDHLLEQINEYQVKRVKQFETLQPEIKSKELVDELKAFHDKWTRYLNKCQIKDCEMNAANEIVDQLDGKFMNEKKHLHQSVFGNKMINFRTNSLKINKDLLGTLDYDTIGAIDFTKLKVVQLKDVLKNFKKDHFIENFDSFNEAKLALVYPNTLNKISLAIMDKEGTIYKSIDSEFHFKDQYRMQLKTFREILIFYFMNANKNNCLVVMNSNLEMTKSKLIDFPAFSLDANEANIYCLSYDNKISVFDHQLVFLRTFGQSSCPHMSFYLTDNIERVAFKANKIFCLLPRRIEVMNEHTGVVFKSIPVVADQIAFDSFGNLLVFSFNSFKIFKYNCFNGAFLGETQIENLENGLDFSAESQGRVVFFSRTQSTFYFET